MSRMGILAGAAATLLVFAALHVITTMQLRPTEEGGPHYTSVSTSSAPPYISLNVAAINDSLFTSTHQPSVVEGEGVVWVAPSSWVSLAVITSQATRGRLEHSLVHCLQPFLDSQSLLLLSDAQYEGIPSLVFEPREGQGMSTRVFTALQHMLDHASPQVRWFVLCDDDTYVLWESLLHVLGHKYAPPHYDPLLQHLYIGNYNENNKGDKFYFAFGGGGVVLSRALVSFLAHPGLHTTTRHTYNDNTTQRSQTQSLLSYCLAREGNRPGDYGLYLCLHDVIPAIAQSIAQHTPLQGDEGVSWSFSADASLSQALTTYTYPFTQEKCMNQLDLRELAVHYFEAVMPLYTPCTLHHLDLLTYWHRYADPPSIGLEQQLRYRALARDNLGQMSRVVPWYLRFRPLTLLSTASSLSSQRGCARIGYVLYVGYSLRLYCLATHHNWHDKDRLTQVFITWTDWAHWVPDPPVEAIYNHLDSPYTYSHSPPPGLCNNNNHNESESEGGMGFARYEASVLSEATHVYSLATPTHEETQCAKDRGLPWHVSVRLHVLPGPCPCVPSSPLSSSLGPSLGDGGVGIGYVMCEDTKKKGTTLHVCYRRPDIRQRSD